MREKDMPEERSDLAAAEKPTFQHAGDFPLRAVPSAARGVLRHEPRRCFGTTGCGRHVRSTPARRPKRGRPWDFRGISAWQFRRDGLHVTTVYQMKPYWKVTLWYLGFGVLWIFLSDRITAAHAGNIESLTKLQTVKGWCFVLVSGLFIFHLTKRSFNEALAKDRENHSVFKKTVEGVYHILRNYLNQMQLVTMEAERCNDFDKEIVAMSKDISEQALGELQKLDEIDTITPDRIESVVYGDMRRGKNSTS